MPLDESERAPKAESPISWMDRALHPLLQVELQSLEQNVKLRKTMTWFLLVTYGAANLTAIVLLFFNGFGLTTLSDTVLVAVLTATVAELAGIVIVVAQYLFPQNKKS